MTSTLATRQQATVIRQRMQEIRNDLPRDASVARARVQQLTDWKYHLRQRPWPILAVAAVVGFLLVPSKSRAKALPTRMDPLPTPSRPPNEYSDHPTAKNHLLGGLAGAVLSLAIRTSATIATRHLCNLVLDRSTSPGDDTSRSNQSLENSSDR